MTLSDSPDLNLHDVSIDTRSGRDRILEHARLLFLERGFRDVSMREIAEAAGLRKATIYHHFQDKEALFIAIMLAEVEHSRQQMAESIAGLTALPERLEELAFTHFSQTRSTSWRLAQNFRDHIPESRHEEMHEALGRLFEIYQSVFADALTAGEIEGIDPTFAASSFFQTIISWMWDFPGAIGAREMPPRELARIAVKTLLYGIAGPDLRSSRARMNTAT